MPHGYYRLAEAHWRPLKPSAQQRALPAASGGERVFLVRISAGLEDGAVMGFVVTFDEITQLLAAQRKAAWSDIARRIAHEIKNPLTPIQLAAERLKRKYVGQITSDRETFQVCRSEEHTSDLQSLMRNSYAVFCLHKKTYI